MLIDENLFSSDYDSTNFMAVAPFGTFSQSIVIIVINLNFYN